MDHLDLTVMTARADAFEAMKAMCSATHPVAHLEGCVGTLKPDFGPAYRAAIVRLDRAASLGSITETLRALPASYTVLLGGAIGLPGARLRRGDVVLSRAIRAAADPRGAHTTDPALLRRALALDAVDHRWTTRIAAPCPDPGQGQPRLFAGAIACGSPDETDLVALRALTETAHRLVAADLEGPDAVTVATAAALEGRSGHVVMVRGIERVLSDAGDDPPSSAWTAYAVAAAASFVESWVRYAWPTRPVSAATGQTPKGTRISPESRTLSAPQRTTTASDTRPPGAAPPSTGPIRGVPRSRARIISRGAASTASGPIPIPARPRTMSGPLPRVTEPRRSTPGSGPVSLRARLARIYPTVEDARRVIAEAGLALDDVPEGGSSDVRWHRILTTARLTPDGIERLLEVIVREGH